MKESVNRDTKKVAGVDVTIVDISGTFKDQPRGPFGPSVDRKDYRMLAAIIPTANSGNYYVKVTGPAKTIAANNEKFVKFIESLQLK